MIHAKIVANLLKLIQEATLLTVFHKSPKCRRRAKPKSGIVCSQLGSDSRQSFVGEVAMAHIKTDNSKSGQPLSFHS